MNPLVTAILEETKVCSGTWTSEKGPEMEILKALQKRKKQWGMMQFVVTTQEDSSLPLLSFLFSPEIGLRKFGFM